MKNIRSLIEEAESRGVPISEIIILLEIEETEVSRKELMDKMHRNWAVMKEAITEGIRGSGGTMGGLVKGAAKIVNDAVEGGVVPRDRLSRTVMRALAVAEVNASMGLIVAAPTAGACGILPAVLRTAQEDLGLEDEDVVKSLFTAAGIGMVIAANASVSGAEGGCQAECGSAGAMAAGALVELAGGTPRQVGEAAALCLKNSLGLVCDPVAGLVEVPCIKRNAFLAVSALAAADLALAGVSSAIPTDEVIGAMDEIGRLLPVSLKETAKGGLAATPTGQKIKERFGQK